LSRAQSGTARSSITLFGLDGFHGAAGSAGAAINASVLIDDVYAVVFLDSADGAGSCAGSATDAAGSDFMCHKDTSNY